MSRRALLGIGGGGALLLGGVGAWFVLGSDGGGGGGLSYGSSVQGQITQGGPSDPFFDKLSTTYTFSGTSGDRVQIDMTSEEIDPYLILEGPGGDMIATDDDGNPTGFLDSRLGATLPATGEYTIWATSYSGMDTGDSSSRSASCRSATPEVAGRCLGEGWPVSAGGVETRRGLPARRVIRATAPWPWWRRTWVSRPWWTRTVLPARGGGSANAGDPPCTRRRFADVRSWVAAEMGNILRQLRYSG